MAASVWSVEHLGEVNRTYKLWWIWEFCKFQNWMTSQTSGFPPKLTYMYLTQRKRSHLYYNDIYESQQVKIACMQLFLYEQINLKDNFNFGHCLMKKSSPHNVRTLKLLLEKNKYFPQLKILRLFHIFDHNVPRM